MEIVANVSSSKVMDELFKVGFGNDYFANRFKSYCFRYLDNDSKDMLYLVEKASKAVGGFMQRSLCHHDNVLNGVTPIMPPEFNAWSRIIVATDKFLYTHISPVVSDNDVVIVDTSYVSDIDKTGNIIFVFEKYYADKETALKDFANFGNSIKFVVSEDETHDGYQELKTCVDSFNDRSTWVKAGKETYISTETGEYYL